jgi:hypothetical protein
MKTALFRVKKLGFFSPQAFLTGIRFFIFNVSSLEPLDSCAN